MFIVQLILVIFAIFTLAIICVAYTQCKMNTEAWKDRVAYKLQSSFHLQERIAVQLTDLHFPTFHTVFADQPHPDIAAHQIFWDEGVQEFLNRTHYSPELGFPYHMFSRQNYGRVNIEV
jgi:hypothetical protein